MNFKKYWRKSSLKRKNDGNYLLKHIYEKKPKNFLEVGVFHGVTSRNVCELLFKIHSYNFKFTGVDLFENDKKKLNNEIAPSTIFSNPLKNLYYKHIVKIDPYSYKSVMNLLSKFENNVNIIKGDSNSVLKKIGNESFDYVFLDGGHNYNTVRNDLINLTNVIINKGTVMCDDYNLTYAPGIREAIDEYVSRNKFHLKILNDRFAEITNR